MAQRRECVVVLDLGTSSLKCGAVARDGELLCFGLKDLVLDRNSDRCECDFEEAGAAAIELVKGACAEAGSAGHAIVALAITSQAQTFVPVDSRFKPLRKGIVWLDSRAGEESEYLARTLTDFGARSGLPSPLPTLYISKLLWLKNNEPDVFGTAAHFPLIHEFIGRQLTGRFYTDSCNFGMGGLLDLRARQLNRDVLRALELDAGRFPEIGEPARLSYGLSESIGSEAGIDPGTPVFYCGNDQSSSAAGAGAREIGDVSVNFGTAMVAYACVEALRIPGRNGIAGICPLNAPYFLLSYEDNFGNVIDDEKRRTAPEATYDEFLRGAASLTGRMVGRFEFHIGQMEDAVKPRRLLVSGGLAASEVWLDMIRKRCPYEIECTGRREAGIVGAAAIWAVRNESKSQGKRAEV